MRVDKKTGIAERFLEWADDPNNFLLPWNPDESELAFWMRSSTWRAVAILSAAFAIADLLVYEILRGVVKSF
jgi:hypothetical protein